MKAVIVGGGVIGMLQARAFAERGYEVVLIDQAQLGREASWAGGGIISPLYPWRYSAPVTALASRSQTLYPELVKSVQKESGVDPEFSQHGLLMLRVDDEQQALEWANQTALSQNKRVPWLEEIDAQKLYELEPHLADGHQRSLWMPSVASIRNPRLLNALRAIMASRPNIEILEEHPVLNCDDHYVELQDGQKIEGDMVVVCSGAWTSRLLPQSDLKIEPVKGQMIVFDAPKGLVNRVVLSEGRYVIPRKDGKVVAGSTLEYSGFDKTTDARAKESLADSAFALFPELKKAPIGHHWAGLRPGSVQGVPSIGLLPNKRSLYVNAGHFRNGLVLAPASVELLCALVAKQCSEIDVEPYAPALKQAV